MTGYPLPSTAVPSRILRFTSGNVIANADVFIPKGYQMLYSNTTYPGMSGGSVINEDGHIVGIHGQGELTVWKLRAGNCHKNRNKSGGTNKILLRR